MLAGGCDGGAAAGVGVLRSVEEYLHGEFEPDVDFVDGRIEERNAGEFEHSTWQEVLQAWFRDHYKDWNLRARPELRTRVTATRYRVPDVAVMDMALPVEQILVTPPVAVFEVLSPEDTLRRMMVKLGDYERMGVQNVFLIDPEVPSFSQYRHGNLSLAAERVELVGTQGFVDWKAIQELIY